MKLKIVLILILPICMVLSTSIAQNQISKKILFQLTESELQYKSIIQISPKREMIIKEIQGDQNNFFLSSIDKPSEKILLFTAYNDQKPRVNFSQEGEFIYYTLIENGKKILGTYERATGKRLFIRDETNNVVSSWSAVSPASGKIIYQVREERAFPKVFMAQPDGSEPRFITEGMGESWAPNGKWFAVKCPENISDFRILQNQNLNGKTKKILRTDNIKWVYRIFSENGNPLIELKEYSRPNYFFWAPNSDHFIIQDMKDHGFWVSSVKEINGNLQSQKLIHFELDKVRMIEPHKPFWSPDGKMIVYVKSFMDEVGNSYIKNEIWVSTIDGEKEIRIREMGGLPVWTNDGKILIKEGKNYSKGVSILEISINDL